MTGVQWIDVAPGEGDQRLDRWFRRRFPHVPQGRIEKMCRKGEIRLDGRRARPGARVEDGQTVRVPPLPAAESQARLPEGPASPADAEMIRKTVIYRDEHVIALNKPSGLAVQGGSKQRRHVDGLAEALRFGREDKPRLVHRLDRDTSGILLLARTRAVANALGRTFRARAVRKVYWAAVAGVPNPRTGVIRYGLAKARGSGRAGEGEKARVVLPEDVERTPDARHATTDYAVLAALGSRASWVALIPVTGRTHQLRAHMAGIGHPVVGDGKYGGSGQENPGHGWGAQLGGEISRKLHLHARSLLLDHPVTGNRLELVAHLPPHMKQTWKMLDWDASGVPADPFEGAGRP